MKIAVHWFRRDLRVADNTALTQAACRAEAVYPLFILDDQILGEPDMGAVRVSFLLASLRSLRANLRQLGYSLVVRRGQPEVELLAFCREVRAQAVFCNRDYEPYCQQRDSRVFQVLNTAGIGFEILKDAVIWEDQDLLSQKGTPYTVFTPYAKAWRARAEPPPRPQLRPVRPATRAMRSIEIPRHSAELGLPLAQTLIQGGEEAGQNTLRNFVEHHLLAYGESRDFPALESTSRLSPHLHFGTVNIRTILAAIRRAVSPATPEQRVQAEVFRTELIWREFYLQILAHFPRVAQGCYRTEYDALEWSDNQDHLQAWQNGLTGYPIIDAAMRCLNATGWMHNRNRMVVAMFLAKDLLLPWSYGERYFMRKLVDGDLAANNGGWQWCAGTGTDAAPYFRIFNPITQGQKFDPEGKFVRRWIPELAGLDGRAIHEPWLASPTARKGYPDRIVDHNLQRKKCLAMFARV